MRTIVQIEHPAVTHAEARAVAERVAADLDAEWPGTGRLLRLVDAVVAEHAGPAERLRIAESLSTFACGVWDHLEDADCVWVAYMMLRLDAQNTGEHAAAATWRAWEDEAMARAQRRRRTASGTWPRLRTVLRLHALARRAKGDGGVR